MLYSKHFTDHICVPRVPFGKKFEVDQFPNSEFFRTESGMELKDYHVALNSSPEVQEKMRQYLVEREVQGFDPSVPDEEVMKSITSRYASMSSILSDLQGRIGELRKRDDLAKLEKKDSES